VLVEYAKASPEDILIQITVFNRGPEPATLNVLPTIWFRSTWSWGGNASRPVLRQAAVSATVSVLTASHPELGERYLYCEGANSLLFTDNETNTMRLVGAAQSANREKSPKLAFEPRREQFSGGPGMPDSGQMRVFHATDERIPET
jgi:hypothetical protein